MSRGYTLLRLRAPGSGGRRRICRIVTVGAAGGSKLVVAMRKALGISLVLAASVAFAALPARDAHASSAAAAFPVVNAGAAHAAPGGSHAPTPAHAPRPARAPRRPASSRTVRHATHGLVSDLPPAIQHPQLDPGVGLDLSRHTQDQPARFTVPEGRGPPRASPSIALLLPFLASFHRRPPRFRAARRRSSRRPRPDRSPAIPDRVRRSRATPVFSAIRAPPATLGPLRCPNHGIRACASIGADATQPPAPQENSMSAIRSVLVASVLALGIGLAPIAQAETPSPAPAKATTAPTPTSHTKSTSSKSSKPMSHIDLNSASREQLMTLPGITEASADKIIEARPFKSKDELRSKGIVTKAEYDKLASHITAKASKPMTK